MIKPRTTFVPVLTALLMVLVGVNQPVAAAAPSDPTVSSLRVEMARTPEYTSELSLTFAEPVSAATAKKYSDSLLASAPSVQNQLGPTYISCGGSGRWSDSNGRLSLQMTCSDKDYLAWGT